VERARLVDDPPATDRIKLRDDVVAGFAAHQAPSDGRASPQAAVLRMLVARCVAKIGTMARTLRRDVAERGAEPGLKKSRAASGGIDVRRPVRRRFWSPAWRPPQGASSASAHVRKKVHRSRAAQAGAPPGGRNCTAARTCYLGGANQVTYVLC
jgi:hypothetical protein